MTDEWLVDGLPIAGDWTGTGPCAPAGNANSIVDAITITGSPSAITSVQNDKSLWALVLNDGTPEADFRLDRFDDAGALVDSPMAIVRATGVVSFNDPVMLAEDPLEDMEAATKHYVDANAAGLTDAPDDGSFYGRKSLTWANPSHSDITDWAAALAPYALTANVPAGGSALPLINGTAAAGAAAAWSHEDHVHPTDTSRYAASNPAGYQTAAQVTAALAPYALTASVPVASSTTPAMDGTAAVGAGTTWARADHVHPSDTSRYAASNPSGYQTAAQVTASLASYLPLAGGTLTGALAGTTLSLSVGATSPGFSLTNASGTNRSFVGQTNGVLRWAVVAGNNTAEGGSVSGSDFNINSYGDGGGFLATPLSIKRSTSVATFSNAIVNGPSDRTLKENIAPLEGSLDKVLALQGVRFNMIATPSKPEIGLIAQDVQPIVPEVIQTYQTFDAEGKAAGDKLALDYPKLTALLIEAVKTLAARVAELEAR